MKFEIVNYNFHKSAGYKESAQPPDVRVQILLHKMGIKLPNRPAIAGNVVPTLRG